MGRRKRANSFSEDVLMNDASFLKYYDQLTELAISRFEWKNAPDTIDTRFLELTMFEDGQVVWFNDDVLGQLCLPVASMGQLNQYRIPTKRTAYSTGYTFRNLDIENSVIGYNNYLRKPSKPTIMYYAFKLYEIDRTIDVNVNAQKTPVLIACDENDRLSMQQVYMQYEGNRPVIFGSKELRPDTLKVLKTDAPYMADKLYQLKTQYWNEALTYLGISNLNITKKERMVTDEVVRNMGGTIASRYSSLEARRQFAEQINKMFGEKIEVDFRADYRETDDEVMLTGDTEDGAIKTMVTDLRTQTKAGE